MATYTVLQFFRGHGVVYKQICKAVCMEEFSNNKLLYNAVIHWGSSDSLTQKAALKRDIVTETRRNIMSRLQPLLRL